MTHSGVFLKKNIWGDCLWQRVHDFLTSCELFGPFGGSLGGALLVPFLVCERLGTTIPSCNQGGGKMEKLKH